MINGKAREVYESGSFSGLVFVDNPFIVKRIHEMPEGTRFAKIPEPEPMDKFEEVWGNQKTETGLLEKGHAQYWFRKGQEAGK